MKKLFSESKRSLKVAVAILMTFVMVAGSVCPLIRTKAVDVGLNNTTVVYEWNRVSNLSGYATGTRYRLLLIWDYNSVCYCSCGSKWETIKDFDLYDDDDKSNVCTTSTSAYDGPLWGLTTIGNQVALDSNRFYTQTDLNSWYIEKARDSSNSLAHFYMSDGRQVGCNDDSGSCLSLGGYGEPGDKAWTVEACNDNTIKIYYDVNKWYCVNNYWGSRGCHTFCESLSSRPNMTKYIMYVGTPKTWSCISGDTKVDSGTVLNISDNVFLKDGATLTIEPGAVVSVEKQFWNNGTIKNYGTLILRSGAQMNSFNIKENSTRACTVQCYGSEYSMDTARGKLKGEGNLIILSGGFMSLNDKSGPLELRGGATMENFGTAILPYGYIIDSSVLNNHGRIGIGWYFQTKGEDVKNVEYTENAGEYVFYGNGSFVKGISGSPKFEVIDPECSKITNSGTIGFSNSGSLASLSLPMYREILKKQISK